MTTINVSKDRVKMVVRQDISTKRLKATMGYQRAINGYQSFGKGLQKAEFLDLFDFF